MDTRNKVAGDVSMTPTMQGGGSDAEELTRDVSMPPPGEVGGSDTRDVSMLPPGEVGGSDAVTTPDSHYIGTPPDAVVTPESYYMGTPPNDAASPESDFSLDTPPFATPDTPGTGSSASPNVLGLPDPPVYLKNLASVAVVLEYGQEEKDPEEKAPEEKMSREPKEIRDIMELRERDGAWRSNLWSSKPDDPSGRFEKVYEAKKAQQEVNPYLNSR